MKKLLALILALALALCAAWTNNNATVEVATQTNEAKAQEWAKAYYGRPIAKKTNKTNMVRMLAHRAGRILALPLMLFLGIYTVSYKAKDGQVRSKDYARYGDGKLAHNRLLAAGYKDATIMKKSGPAQTKEEIARGSAINFIRKLHLATGEEEFIPMPNSSLIRQIRKLGIVPFDAFMKVDASVKGNVTEDELEIALTKVQHIAADRLIDKRGCAWRPLLASASDKRKGTFLCVREDLYPSMGRWLMCGLKTKEIRMVVSKYLVYLGLQCSASKPMIEVFGWTFDFNRIAVIPDLQGETATPRTCVFVKADNTVETVEDHKEPLNILDGAALFFSNVFCNKAFSFRIGAWTKGCAMPVKRHEVKEWYARKVGGCTTKKQTAEWLDSHEIMIQTIDGPVSIDEVDLVMTESCWKCKGLYRSVHEWAEACIANEYTANVCVQQHHLRLKSLPYQQGQLIAGDQRDAMGVAAHAAAKVQAWRNPEKAAEILPGFMRDAAMIYPEFLQTKGFQNVIQQMYRKERLSMLAGRIPDAAYSAFVMPDPMVFVTHMLGLPVEAQFAENEAVFSGVDEGTEIGLTRNPDTDGHPMVKALDPKNVFFCIEGVLYINPFSWIPILLRLDYDGDHVLVVILQSLVSLYKKTIEKNGETPIVWIAPSGQKSAITVSAIAQALMDSITGSETGIHSDNITKILNADKVTREKLGQEILNWLHCVETKRVNVEIDKTKNAAESTKRNKEAEEVLKHLRDLILPEFCRFAKASDEHPAEDEKYWSKRCRYTGSFLDLYSRLCQKKLPETLEIRLPDTAFDVSKLLINPERRVGQEYFGLVFAGKYNEVTGTYYNEGLFNHICHRTTSEWALADDADNHGNNEELIRAAALKEIEDFVTAQGGDMDGAFDIITRWVFTTAMRGTRALTDKHYEMIFRTYFNLFGQKLFATICMNLGYVPENVDHADDEEEE